MTDNKILKITDDVSWIGVLDRDIVTFDVVMETKYGTTYNSYFISAEKKTIVDTVKEKFWEPYLSKLRKVTDPADIRYIIAHHTEPDHSGCLRRLLEIAPHATVVGSGNAIRYLKDLLGCEFPYLVMKDGQVLDLGNKKLRIIAAPNLHWPDSMITYLEEDKVLFTCDIFGEHFCDERMFDDEVGSFDEPFRYYFNVIMRPFSKFMLHAIEKIRQLEINAICPGHGTILRRNWKRYVDLTEQYTRETLNNPRPNKVFLGYVSAYNNTRMIAEKIAEGITESGELEADVCNLENMDPGLMEQKLIESSALILGSPTFNQNILLPVYQVFAMINPIRDKGKPAASFGSYGWSGEAAKIINSNLANLKLKVVSEGLMIRFCPHKEVLEKCIEFGRSFRRKMLEQK